MVVTKSAVPDKTGGHIQVDIADRVACVTLSNPERLNAITIDMWRQLASVFTDLSAASDLRCVRIQGYGDNFAAGADIREFPRWRSAKDDVIAYHTQILAPALNAIAGCVHPVVAVIKGVCVGGGLEIASQCDLRIATNTARFGVPINRLGFPMAPDEMRGLLALVGPAVTLEILLEGRVFGADEALAKGLLTRVVDDAELDEHVNKLVQRLAQGAPLAARINKETVRRLSPKTAPLSRAEIEHLFRYAESQDHHEGVKAFLGGQTPVFTGE